MKYVLALDQGTTSSRALLFDHEGNVRSVAQREFEQIFPRPGWVEHDPEQIASSQIAVALEALAKARRAIRATSPPSASPTSARRQSYGIATRATQSATQSSGKIAAPPISASASAARATVLSSNSVLVS